jgi:hypothetical protein
MGGKAIWSEQKQLVLKKGVFTTLLGDVVSFAEYVRFDRQYWLYGYFFNMKQIINIFLVLFAVDFYIYTINTD